MYFDGSPVEEGLVRKMADVQQHRGPDGSGVYTGSCAGLGHRRLAIIDLSAGKQPLANEDERVWISFNGAKNWLGKQSAPARRCSRDWIRKRY